VSCRYLSVWFAGVNLVHRERRPCPVHGLQARVFRPARFTGRRLGIQRTECGGVPPDPGGGRAGGV